MLRATLEEGRGEKPFEGFAPLARHTNHPQRSPGTRSLLSSPFQLRRAITLFLHHAPGGVRRIRQNVEEGARAYPGKEKPAAILVSLNPVVYARIAEDRLQPQRIVQPLGNVYQHGFPAFEERWFLAHDFLREAQSPAIFHLRRYPNARPDHRTPSAPHQPGRGIALAGPDPGSRPGNSHGREAARSIPHAAGRFSRVSERTGGGRSG